MAHYPGYTVLRTEDCPEQHGTLTLLTHDVSGAAVLLVENEDVNKAFGIGFGTFPSDDTGVFHILEHSVLAGSEKYPVSSPFVQLLKSSMASFLNAMTFPDKTVYPFATPNETDFCNLMDVYLNAVFCPLAMVDSAVFEQEGWHRDADGTVSGVVYNEMQGALASPDAQLQNALQRAMFPDTAYGFVSGGDPASIPALTYEKYQRVYRRHYSADNCCITLYGKMDMADKLARLDKDYLSKMPKAAARPRLTMQDEQPGAFVELPYYTDQPKPDEVQCALAWYTGAFADRERQLGVEILLGALLSTNSSPLKAALLAEQLGADIDIGFDDSTLQPTLELLLRGATVDSARKFAPAVRKAVDELLKTGIPHDLLLAALNEAEFASLERPGSLPDGVLDAINAATGWLHTGDAALLLHTDKLFVALRSKLEEGWFDTLLRELFAPAPVQVLQIPTAPKTEDAAAPVRTDGKLVLSPSSATANGWAKVTVTTTDHYSRTLSRSFTVVMSGSVISGVSLDQTQLNLLVTQKPVQLNATLAGSSNRTFNDVTWTSSNPAVATVENGLVTPVDVGDCTITVKTLDGGYTATCAVTVRADYSVLEAKYAEYQILVNQAKGQYIYTEDSLAVLETACGQAKAMIDSGLSTQAEIDAQVELLESAHNGLVKYIIAEGVSLTADTEAQANVTIPNPGHIRYLHNELSLKNKTVQLSAVTAPAGGLYQSITWSSSNDKVTVSDTGLVTNTDSGNQWAEITCTITTVKGDSFTATTTVCFTRYAVTGVSMDTDMVHGSPQDTVTITPTVTSTATIASLALRDCTFTSDHPEIATVDNSGKITFVSQGKATITATTVDGGYTATVIAYTTYDFSALQQAIADAGAVDYKDYAYDYGMAFKTAYDKAVAVNADYESSQDVIDAATSALKQAQNALVGHEFVGPGEIGFTSGGAAVTEGKALVVNDNQQVTLSAAYADGAMVQDPSWTTAAENNVTAATDAAGNLVLTKTNADASGSVKVTYTLKDAYDRTYTKTITVKLVNQKVNIDSFKFTYDGNEVESVSYGCSGVYTNKSIQLGVSTYPADADAYVSALWTSNNKNLVVDQTGKVSASGAMFGTKYTATITCTLTLEDGSTVTNSIQVTFNRF